MAEKKLRGLLDRAQATIGGLLGDFPQGFNAGAVAGVAGYPGDIAYMLDTAGRAITGQDTQPAAQDFPGTTDYIAAKAGYPIPGSFSGQLGAAVGGLMTPGPGDLGRLAPLGAMFLGAKAKTAMPDVLNMAQEMEKAGASADDIWLATGAKGQPWFKGADGKWKFWISDKNAEYRPGAVVGQAKEEHAAMLDEAEAAVIMRHQMDRAGLGVGEAKDWFRQAFGRDPPEGAGQWLRNYDAITLMQRYLGLESRGVPSFSNIGAPLSRFLYHPELYAAVPELANMPVRGVTPGALGPGIGGRASLAKGIEIRDDIMPMLETGKSILSHEIQHPIQELMGFGTGANTAALAKESAQAEEQIQIFNDELRVMRQALDRAQQSGDYVQAERITQESIRMQKQRNALIKLAQRDPEMAYWNAAGEAEARNTQTLLDKGPEDWATFRPWLTQDVPTEQQIVRFGDGPAMAEDFAARRAGKAKPYKEAMGFAPNDDALVTAQRNAAKPVEDGGLGLPPNNTPADRATAMGYVTDVYHGTINGNIQDLKPSDMESIFTDVNPEVANMYAGGFWTTPIAKDMLAESGQEYAPNVLPLKYQGKRNAEYSNVIDKNPAKFRSRFAVFDPFKRESHGLLAGLAALGIGLGAVKSQQDKSANEAK